MSIIINPVEAGRQVTLHFSLSMTNGDIIDSNMEDDPATLVLGQGTLPENFENCLLGLLPGDTRQWVLPPEKAFGNINARNIHWFPQHQFAPDMLLEKGVVVAFSDPGGGELPGVVEGIRNNQVKINFNHPLAGKTIVFDVRIVSVH